MLVLCRCASFLPLVLLLLCVRLRLPVLILVVVLGFLESSYLVNIILTKTLKPFHMKNPHVTV